MIWRLWQSGKVTLEELETTWSIDDVMRAQAILDMFAYYEKLEMEKIKNK